MCKQIQKKRGETVNSKSDQRLIWFFKLSGKLRTDRADSNAADIVEKVELCYLLVPIIFVMMNNDATESRAVSMTLIISILTPTVSF